MKKMISFKDGSYLPTSEIMIPATDITVLRGYGIFDYFPFEHGQPLFLSDYLDRIFNSVQKMNLHFPYSRKEIREIIFKLIEKNGSENGAFRCLVSGGVSENYYKPAIGSFIIFQEKLPSYPSHLFEKGIKLEVVSFQRAIAKVKTINYAWAINYTHVLSETDAEDVLYHKNGLITESSRSNFFALKGKTIITADDGILEGVTRKNLLAMAKDLGYKIELAHPKVDDIATYDGVFMTSSTKGVMPVQTIYVDKKPHNFNINADLQALMSKFAAIRLAYFNSKVATLVV